jgi:SAM-dependent methyltransferase
MSEPESRRAWADFWSNGQGGTTTCLPGALQRIDAVQTATWQSFAYALTRRAHVLDLGTGDGVVLRKLQQARSDLRLTGVDSAPLLPRPPQGLTLRPAVSIEKLPFASARFDAISSQFGYEYSHTEASAGEVARVLKPGGRFLFIVHDRGGPILSHNLLRRNALRWVLSEAGYLNKASALVQARRFASLPTPPLFRDACAEASRLLPGQSAAGEFLQALFQTLELSRSASASEALAALAELESKARFEIARIDALDRAACDAEQLMVKVEELRRAGLSVDVPAVLTEQLGKPFAWVLLGSRLSGPGTSQ